MVCNNKSNRTQREIYLNAIKISNGFDRWWLMLFFSFFFLHKLNIFIQNRLYSESCFISNKKKIVEKYYIFFCCWWERERPSSRKFRQSHWDLANLSNSLLFFIHHSVLPPRWLFLFLFVMKKTKKFCNKKTKSHKSIWNRFYASFATNDGDDVYFCLHERQKLLNWKWREIKKILLNEEKNKSV